MEKFNSSISRATLSGDVIHCYVLQPLKDISKSQFHCYMQVVNLRIF
jgi:hypothetical protein